MNFVLNILSKNAARHTEEFSRKMEQKISLPEDLQEFPDMEYSAADGTKLFADVFLPKGRGTSSLPVAVFAHGGGLFTGNRKFNHLFCENLARRGFLVFSAEYRMLSDADALGEISDLCRGLCFAEKQSGRFGGDLSRVFLLGESAGAYLALYAAAAVNSGLLQPWLSESLPSFRIRGIACFSGMFYTTKNDPVGMVYKKDLYGKLAKNSEFIRLMNPQNRSLLAALPPLFLTSSLGDFLRSYTLSFAKALEKEDHSHKLIYYGQSRQLGHAFPSMAPLLPESIAVMDALVSWLNDLRE